MIDPVVFMRKRIKEALGDMSFAIAAERSGGKLTKSSLHNWVTGKTTPGVDSLVEIGIITGHDLSFFLPAEDKKASIYVQKLDVHAAAGDGADNSCATVEEELNAMADRIGIARSWRHGDHYDICQAKRALAVAFGAIEITKRQAVVIRRLNRLKRPLRHGGQSDS